MMRPLRLIALLAGSALVLLPAAAHAEPHWQVGPRFSPDVLDAGPNASALVGTTTGFARALRIEYADGRRGPTSKVPLVGEDPIVDSASLRGDVVAAVVAPDPGGASPMSVVSGPLGAWPSTPFLLADPVAQPAGGGSVVVVAGPGGAAAAARITNRHGTSSLLTAMRDRTGTWHVAAQSLGAVHAGDLQVRWTSHGPVTTVALTAPGTWDVRSTPGYAPHPRIAVAVGLEPPTIVPFPHSGPRTPRFRHTAMAGDGSILAIWQEADRMLLARRPAGGTFGRAQLVATGVLVNKGVRMAPVIGGRHVTVLIPVGTGDTAVRTGIVGRPLGRVVSLGPLGIYIPQVVVTPRGRTALIVANNRGDNVGLGLHVNGTIASRVRLDPPRFSNCFLQDGPYGGGDETAVARLQCTHGPYLDSVSWLLRFR
jgi:hypothetical protein